MPKAPTEAERQFYGNGLSLGRVRFFLHARQGAMHVTRTVADVAPERGVCSPRAIRYIARVPALCMTNAA
ncbi:hypothetical protein GCM10027285_17940 [Oleiagrimonas citrea]